MLKLLGKVILRILIIDLCNSLRKSNILQLKAKNSKIRNRRPKHTNKTSQVPVKNLSDYDIDTSSLKYELQHSFINKNKFIKRDLPVEFESLVTIVDELVTQNKKKNSTNSYDTQQIYCLKMYIILRTTLSKKRTKSEITIT